MLVDPKSDLDPTLSFVQVSSIPNLSEASKFDQMMYVLETVEEASQGRLEGEALASRLLSLLAADIDDFVKDNVVRALAKWARHDPRVVAALTALAASPTVAPALRAAATHALLPSLRENSSLLPTALAALAVNVRHKSPQLRAATLALLSLALAAAPSSPASVPASTSASCPFPVFPALVAAIQDADHRVRHAALTEVNGLHAALTLAQVRVLVPTLVAALRDDAPRVRLEALRLLAKVTERFPMLPLRLVSGAQAIKVQTPLRSYAFTKISEMIIDIDMAVRVESSRILGELKHIGIDAMLQTLSKRVLPPSAVPSGATADDAMDVDAEQSALSEPLEVVDRHLAVSQAAGAFVLGLEDEFLQVRGAAIESISQLARRSRDFALEALPSLVDMFNDEITDIRIKTIDCLRHMGDIVSFDANQLQIVLATLEEANPATRRATFALLSSCRLGSSENISTTINALVTVTLVKYPSDQNDIYSCLARLGRNHADLIALTAKSLLGVSDVFLTKEPSLASGKYLGTLIAVCAASSVNPSLFEALPSWFEAHFEHVRWRFPFLGLTRPHSSHPFSLFPSATTANGEGGVMMESLTSAIVSSASSLVSKPHLLLHTLCNYRRDVGLLAEYDSSLSDRCERLGLWIDVGTSLLQIKMCECPEDALRSLSTALTRLVWSFAPPIPHLASLAEAFSLLCLDYLAQSSNSLKPSTTLALFDEPRLNLHFLETSKSHIETQLSISLRDLEGLFPWFGDLVTSLRDPKTPINLSGLLAFAVSLPPRKKLSASLTLVGCIDRIVEFNAAYGGSIPARVELNQPISGDDFRILVTWPDSNRTLYRLADPETMGDEAASFETILAFNSQSWSQASQIKAQLIRLCTSTSSRLIKSVLRMGSHSLSDVIDFVPISEVAQVQVHPKYHR